MPSPVFSADTFPPATKNPQIFETRYKKILQVSRERFSKPKDLVEARINKTMKEVEKAEKVWAEKIKKQKQPFMWLLLLKTFFCVQTENLKISQTNNLSNFTDGF